MRFLHPEYLFNDCAIVEKAMTRLDVRRAMHASDDTMIYSVSSERLVSTSVPYNDRAYDVPISNADHHLRFPYGPQRIMAFRLQSSCDARSPIGTCSFSVVLILTKRRPKRSNVLERFSFGCLPDCCPAHPERSCERGEVEGERASTSLRYAQPEWCGVLDSYK